MKKIFYIIVVAVAITIILCSCGSARDIDNVDLCRTLGIERTNSGVKIYAEGEELQTIEAATVAEGITVLGANEDKPMFFSHVERIVLDVGAWDNGSGLDFLLRDPDLRLGTNLYMCNNVGDMFKCGSLTDYLETQERFYKALSVTKPTTAGAALSGISGEVLVPSIVKRDGKPSAEGFIYIRKGEIISSLGRDAAIGANILKNRMGSAIISAGGASYKLTKARASGRDAVKIKVEAEVRQASDKADEQALRDRLERIISNAQTGMGDEREVELEVKIVK